MNTTQSPALLSEKAVPDAPQKGLLRRIGFYLLNIWLIFHICAVCAAPLSVSPASYLEQSLWETTSPYVQLLYQNNGFHFFAPNPEGCNTVHYAVSFEDGSTQQGMFPHRGIWPRLLYHRHLMLSNYLGASEGEFREKMIRDFAYQICKSHAAQEVSLTLVWHDLALRERIIAGGTLFDEDLYRETPLGTFTWDELSATFAKNSAAIAAE